MDKEEPGRNAKGIAFIVGLALVSAACGSNQARFAGADGGSPDRGEAGLTEAGLDAGFEIPRADAPEAGPPDASLDAESDLRQSPVDAAIVDAAIVDAPPDESRDTAPDLAPDRAAPTDTARAEAGKADAPAAFDYFSTCPSAVPKAGDVDVEIFILAGQSNASGHGRKLQLADRTTRTVPFWAQNQKDGWTGAPTRSSDTGIMYPMPDACDGTLFATDPTSKNTSLVWQPWLDQVEDLYGPELAFIADVQRRMPGHRFVMLKTALGGSNIESDWNPTLRGLTYDALVRQIEAAKASLSANGKSYRFVGLLWMQGENGAASINTWQSKSTRFADLTKQLFAAIRAITDANMPIVLGRIGDQMLADNVIDAMVTPSTPKDQLIAATNYRRSEQVRVARETSACAWVDSDGLPVLHEADPALWYHHTSAGELALGERFASAWAALVGR